MVALLSSLTQFCLQRVMIDNWMGEDIVALGQIEKKVVINYKAHHLWCLIIQHHYKLSAVLVITLHSEEYIFGDFFSF